MEILPVSPKSENEREVYSVMQAIISTLISAEDFSLPAKELLDAIYARYGIGEVQIDDEYEERYALEDLFSVALHVLMTQGNLLRNNGNYVLVRVDGGL